VSQSGPLDRSWERWLKGSDTYLRITFDPVTASEDHSVMFITPTHPLARQAARAFDSSTALSCSVSVKSAAVAPGRHPFAIYRWRVMGLVESFTFQPICESEEHAEALLQLLEGAVACQDPMMMTADEEACLEERHYRLWLRSRAEHVESAVRSAEMRLASLTVSHSARVALLEEQRDQISDAGIRRMKEGQIGAANRDYERRKSELERVAGAAEIVSEVAVLGVLHVNR